MTREVSFQLVDGEGEAVTKAYCVDCADDAKVFRLLDAVKVKCPNALANVDAPDLTVFANRAADTPRGIADAASSGGPDDLFIMYCTSEVTVDLCMLPNSAFVDATCWEAYYGPFAARAFFIKSVPLPCINTSSQVQLELVEGVQFPNSKEASIHELGRCSCEDKNSSQGSQAIQFQHGSALANYP
ncbi:unnamed protein product [Phytophthora fragariaefolia]|uniref:Unnamed protein product n=1 Tax=Phytophthora fragariaefolia TaxID=1490495 RepID=A0A9W6U3G0_9STRA|nr:unnamed protein product [Phytophthora fragariaefolia]